MLREYPSRRFKNACWIVLLALLAVYWATLLYTDIIITYTHSLELLTCLWENHFLDFYTYSLEHTYIEGIGGGGPFLAAYPLPVYIVFAVWNLPIWLLSKLGILWYPNNPWCLLWCKTLLIVFLVGVCRMVRKILRAVGQEKEKSEEAIFLLLTTLLFVVQVLAVAQYDIICLFFILWGIWQRLRDGRLSWKVMAIFSLAITFKYFAVLPYLIIVLLDEKRIWKIVCDLLAGMAATVLVALPFAFTEGQANANEFNKSLLDMFFFGGIEGGLGSIPLFPAAMFAICLYAYCVREKETSTKAYLIKVSWLTFAAYFAMFLFAGHSPYWVVLLPPFLVMILILQEKQFHINTLLLTVFDLGLLAMYSHVFYWVYLMKNNFEWLLLKNVGTVADHNINNLEDVYIRLGIQNYMPIFYAAFAVAGLAILYINAPWKKDFYQDADKNTLYYQKGLYAFRVFCVAAYLLVTVIVAYFI